MGYDNSFSVDSIGRKGGLTFIWKAEFEVEVIGSSCNFIDLHVKSVVEQVWRLTVFYGCPERNRRRDSWKIIQDLSLVNSLPWCIIGDFNDILSHDEKRGGARQPSWLVNGFREAILNSGLSDMGATSYKYTWSRGRDSAEVIENSWRCRPEADFLEKLSFTMEGLKSWSGDCAPKFRSRLKGIRDRMRRFQKRTDTRGLQQYNNLVKEYNNLLGEEEVYWKQRAKRFWLSEGDSNTRYFKNFATGRKRVNRVDRLRDEQGIWRDTKQEVDDIILRYFETLFTEPHVGSIDLLNVETCISDLDNEFSLSPLSNLEVRNATFNGLNNKNIALTPKVNNPETVFDLTPISLCNVAYKIISKVLANRMKNLMPKIISENQSAFVENRLITDNFLIAYEIGIT
ncbi:uncharacterized protein LOC126687780 [Mercurialis annua]|uniref:uncharacterized protein LOC126687780 n=1 Tax=Mercurialis annua TaxID=3986 RepID=UPI00215F407C|nr:uncharacterized protein LOC126687780 [Mercurialis annua]